jgi:hypothetical protein
VAGHGWDRRRPRDWESYARYAGNVHEVAQQSAPDVRVIYVDNDPIVHVHASALLTGAGTTSIVLADLASPRRSWRTRQSPS